ncbi:fimbrillin family protein [Parabacteroides timonensis]|uniref:fimbrillin family protein n=1 Tax=Parabacteroides timonensis TaxID=1871013 RepID=UPI00094EF5EE|nr:fimbrillin family protein [Parabacteroides timonensis]
MKPILQYGLLFCFGFFFCTACTEESDTEIIDGTHTYLRAIATIGDATTVQTKTEGDGGGEAEDVGSTPPCDIYGTQMDKLYSYLPTSNKDGGFKEGDKAKIGIYSLYGVGGSTDEDRLINIPLTHVGGKKGYFQNEDIKIPSMTNLGRTLAYYPYNEHNKGADESTGIDESSGDFSYPISLYYEDGFTNLNKDDKNKVIDLLVAVNSGTVTSTGEFIFSFKHACSMLLIFPGEGFEHLNTPLEGGTKNDDASGGSSLSKEVTVYLKHSINARVTYKKGGNFSLSMDKTGADDHLEFPTNRCDAYKLAGTSWSKSKTVYSVILPPEAEIDYIKMTDDNGTVQYVRPAEDLAVHKPLTGGTRYPITVKLEGVEPAIYPHEIVEWDDVTVKIESRGIDDLEDLKGWMEAYNDGNNDGNNENLSKYGENNGGKWTFYLNKDIDCSSLEESYQYLIKTFNATLDGRNHTLSGLKFKKSTTRNDDNNIGFIGKLAEGGTVKRLKIDGITIEKDNLTSSDNIGTIAGTIAGGTVENCTVTNINISCDAGNVGALAGTVSSGSAKTCRFEGALYLGVDAIHDDKHLWGKKEGVDDFSAAPIKTNLFVYKSKKVEENTEENTN